MKTLDQIAIECGTDKSSKAHNYTRWYAQHFEPLRHEAIKVLEIGIQNGYSLKMWKEYFTKAHIVGLDIVENSHLNEERIYTVQGSQNDPAVLAGLRRFDIIIDDGSHQSRDMHYTFDKMFRQLNPGGIYVIEDLHCCYWAEFNQGNFMNRLKELTDFVNANGKSGYGDPKNDTENVSYEWWEENIEYIHFYRSIVFIKKTLSTEAIDH